MMFPSSSGKFGIPPLRASHLDRRRLDGRWSECASRRLIQITAGAGSGKTSFTTERARRDDRDVLWLQLGEDDAEPATFLARIAETTLPAGSSFAPPGPESIPDAGRQLLDRLMRPFASRGKSILVVLDDAQFLAGADPTLRLLEYWARILPEGSSLLIASREPLDLRIAKLRAMGEVATISAQDLRFDEAEVAALFRLRFPGEELESKLRRQIVAQTEGWAAGIAILLQATTGPSSTAILRALEGLSRAGSGWFSYFAEEVLNREDRETQTFLLRASVLPRLDPVTCDLVLGGNRSQAVLGRLADRNLFTFQVAEDPVTFRFHNLFREFLQRQLQTRVAPLDVDRLRRRAARALAEAGSWVDAAAAYAEVGDPAAALRLIESYGENLLATGQYQAIRRTFASVPTQLLGKHPIALSVLGRMQEIQGQWIDAAATYRRAMRLRPRGALRAELMILLAQVHMRRGSYAPAGRLCREAMQGTAGRPPKLRVTALCLLGLIAAESGRMDEARDHFYGALAIARKARDVAGEARTLFLAAVNLHAFQGNFREAKDAARKALLIFQGRADQRRISHTMGVLGYLAMCTADEREARDLSEAALRLAETLGYRMIEGYCHYTLGRCALLASEPVHAREHFERARMIGDELEEPALRTLPRIGLAEAALAEGNRHAARAAAGEAIVLARSRRDRFQEALCLVVLGLAGLSKRKSGGSPPARPDEWVAAERSFRKMGARCELNRLLLLDLDAGRLPDRTRAARLRELLENVAGQGHEFLFFSIESERAARVLPAALELDIEPEYVMGILVRIGARSIASLKRLLSSPNEEARARAVEVLARIGGGEARAALSGAADASSPSGRAAILAVEELSIAPSTPLRIRALGPMEIQIAGRTIGHDGWRSSRARRLFQLLLVHRFRWIPKEEVLETLWPESDPAKSEISLRQSVLLLRKTLEPALEETRMSSYVRFRGNTYRLDPGSGYSYDVETFEESLRADRTPGNKDRSQQTTKGLQKAVDLYRGPFLGDTPYEEFLVAERERIADQLLRALDRLLESSAESGQWERSILLSRRGLEIDPFRESFHGHLAQGHLALGHRREALEAYHVYERVMKIELGLPPSPGMRRLAERVTALAPR